ncbi:hypothetical protein F53441_6434 [Fusarium austroafricanum]|uniref:Uncharacterized protein n=1 Tax=Fusarium austroafricanum TaxID=2364996 RepID=A0A8H4NWK4_9HYPO|nr:hypothetical protein F53441_6434 [Fusarium austroafricanum]
MSSDDYKEKTAEIQGPQTTATKPETDDDWHIVTKEETQPSEKQEKAGLNDEKTVEKSEEEKIAEEKKAKAKEKWEGAGPQQRGGVYPHRDVRVPSYSDFTGDW